MPDIGQVSDFSSAISGIVGAVLLVIAGLVYKQARGWFAEVIADVKVTKKQTTNSHKTNLRDDITDVSNTVNTVATAMEDLKASMEDLKTRQGEVHTDIRETRRDMRFATEYVRDVDKRLNAHIDEHRNDEGGNHG